jgi:hypothetical protein
MNPLCVNAADEEVGRLIAGDAGVGEVRRGKDERALADEVAPVAEDGGPLGRVVGDALAVLLVLGVAEEDGALDLLLDRGAELRERSGDDGGTLAEDVLVAIYLLVGITFDAGLPVPAGDDGSLGALLVGHVEETDSLVDGSLTGPLGEEVIGRGGIVRTTDTLDPDVPEFALERPSESGTSAATLFDKTISSCYLIGYMCPWEPHNVAALAGSSGKDENGAGAVRAVAVLEVGSGGPAAELALIQVGRRGGHDAGCGEQGEGGGDLHDGGDVCCYDNTGSSLGDGRLETVLLLLLLVLISREILNLRCALG